ncbi:MAG: RNA polymerase factor sigma-54 [Gammaproteobacteria bacterium]|nr:RNA polymerase factor sigma-54 [Gammaproteobacteria bacterium]
MALKPSLSLKLGQQLRMTPQLQQAIRLLQLSSSELELEIQEALDSNFMLENSYPEEEIEGTNPQDNNQRENSTELKENNDDYLESSTSENTDLQTDYDDETSLYSKDNMSLENIPEDLPVDTSWDDYYGESNFSNGSFVSEEDGNYLETRNSSSETIQSHMSEQINLVNLSEQDRFISISILDALDDDGMLPLELDEILDTLPPDWDVSIEEVEAVLHLIQHLDPLGIGSRNLGEYLTIQLNELPYDTPCKKTALSLVRDYLPVLGNRDYAQLSRKLRINDRELSTAISLIQSLKPRPASELNIGRIEYVEPDVIVSKKNSGWAVELNSKSAPRIRVNNKYSALINKEKSSKDMLQMKSQLQEARWFIKSLQQRNDTLLRVATKIVEHQKDFLENGESSMKPLVLHDIAEAVELHESTISRVTTQKYMLTPSGVFELKYFFSSHVTNNLGGEVSSTAIKAVIKQLVSEENPQKPLSDNKICKLLEQQNITVARRTIAKYRDILMIPPSNERKQLF